MKMAKEREEEPRAAAKGRRFASFFPIGVGAGVAMGVALRNIGVGLAIGAAMGTVMGLLMEQMGEDDL